MQLSAPEPASSKSDDRQFHLLSFKYPVVQLMPFEPFAYLHLPANMETRLPPDKESCQVNTIGTRFFTTLEINAPKAHSEPTTYDDDNVGRLMKAVDDLKTRPGSSCLRVVCFGANDFVPFWDLVYRFELKTEGDLSAPIIFNVNEAQWERLAIMKEEETWIDVLRDLVTRGSERAFFEVQSTLREATWDSLESYRATHRTWQDLDRSVSTSSVEHSIDTHALLQALESSLESLKMPTSVCPPSLCPVSYWETRQVLKGLKRTYEGDPMTFIMRPSDLLESLFGIAMGSRTGRGEDEIIAKAAVTPDLEAFFTLWFTRTVSTLCADDDDSDEVEEVTEEDAMMMDVETRLRDTNIAD